MKVATDDGKLFTLSAETESDVGLLDALDFQQHVCLAQMLRSNEGPPFTNAGAKLLIDASSDRALRTQAQSQVLRALGDLFRLGLAEATRHSHVGAHAADPQPEKALAAVVEELKLVLRDIALPVVKLDVQGQVRTHADTSGGSGSGSVGGAGPDLATHQCQGCRRSYFAAQECDWCPGQQTAPIGGAA